MLTFLKIMIKKSLKSLLIIVIVGVNFQRSFCMQESLIRTKAIKFGIFLTAVSGTLSLADQLINKRYSLKQSLFTGGCLATTLIGIVFPYFFKDSKHKSKSFNRNNLKIKNINNLEGGIIILNGCFVVCHDRDKLRIIRDRSGNYRFDNKAYSKDLSGEFTYKKGILKDKRGYCIAPLPPLS